MATITFIIGIGTVLNKKEKVQSMIGKHFSARELCTFFVSGNAQEIISAATATPNCIVLLEKGWEGNDTHTSMANTIKRRNPTAKIYQYTMRPNTDADAEVFDGIVMVYPVDQLDMFIRTTMKQAREVFQ